MKKIEAKELALISKNKYKMSLFSGKNTSFLAPEDSIFMFGANGEIRNSKYRIGTWKADRTLFLCAYNKRFYFFNIGKNANLIALKTVYRGNESDTVYKHILIGMANIKYHPNPYVDNSYEEFDL